MEYTTDTKLNSISVAVANDVKDNRKNNWPTVIIA